MPSLQRVEQKEPIGQAPTSSGSDEAVVTVWPMMTSWRSGPARPDSARFNANTLVGHHDDLMTGGSNSVVQMPLFQ
jgi:hypothetical protein